MMRTKPASRRIDAYAIWMVLGMTALSLTLFAGAAKWAAQSLVINERNNTYTKAVAAAEAATEIPLAYMARDFLNQAYDPARSGYYGSQIPTNEWATHYEFSNTAGTAGRTQVSTTSTMMVTNLDSQFTGLYGLAYGCQIRGQARDLDSRYPIKATVQQDFQLAAIPVFQFAIFYAMDMEVNPGADMTITGKVHGNANIYTRPGASLQYLDDVGATGRIFTNRHPDDPTPPSNGTIKFWKQHTDGVSSLTLPIATNNTPDAVRGILDVPPFGEDPNSKEGESRYYNNCDLIITTTPTNVIVKSGVWDSQSTLTPDMNTGTTNAYFSFIVTNTSFYDNRETKTTLLTEIDVAKLTAWMAKTNGGKDLNTKAILNLGHDINSLYVNDIRPAGSKLVAVRVVNGRYLPTKGLTVATRLPLYVQGHFNAPDITVGLTNTSSTKPASLLGDAITVLSPSWRDDYSSSSDAADRVAQNTTVNAAFLAGIVQTTNSLGTKRYSGGVENFPRFLESWSSKTLTYNGSMVVMFPSQFAKNWWVAPANSAYYNAPNRKWAFDLNFLDYNKLPPATPLVRKLVRSKWSVVSSN
jgi:hypothetical protein